MHSALQRLYIFYIYSGMYINYSYFEKDFYVMVINANGDKWRIVCCWHDIVHMSLGHECYTVKLSNRTNITI